MKAELLKREGNIATIEINIDEKEFNNAIETAYKRTKSRYNVAGFRKGKAPRKVIELNYGKGVFYNDALDILIPQVYPQAIEELKLDVVASPELDIKSISDEGAIVLEAKVALRPEFEIEKYFGIEVEKESADVTDEEVENEIKTLLDRQSRLVTVDSEIENGNIAVIDFKGMLDGEAFDGGTSEDYSLEIGSNTFIPGFEEQLVGHKAGEEFTIKVTFPEDYPSEELAGKETEFEVKIKEVKVKELPELNDEFVSDTTEFETVEELKSDIRTKKEEQKKSEVEAKAKDDIVQKIADSVEIDIPDAMLEDELNRELDDINRQLSMQGWSLEAFAEMSGQTLQQIKDSRRDDVLKNIKKSLVVSKIYELENLEVSDEEFEKELNEFANAYGMNVEDVRKSLNDEATESIKGRIRTNKTLDLLYKNAVIK